MKTSKEDMSWGAFPFVFGKAIRQAISDYQKCSVGSRLQSNAKDYIFGKNHGLEKELKNLAKLGVVEDLNISYFRKMALDTTWLTKNIIND